MHPVHALILGGVEGLTEFLPISSTGHLILTSHWLGLHGEAVNTFEVVIQAGALGAIIGWYRRRIMMMGRQLLLNLLMSFLPAAMLGVAFHHVIKEQLFRTQTVVAALALGGIAMILLDRWAKRRPSTLSIEQMSKGQALLIGVWQCLALWPGMSRAMVTIVGGFMVGLPLTAATEYSFLLALPTLGAACVFDGVRSGSAFVHQVGVVSILIGFVAAAVVAAWVIRWLIPFVSRHGLTPFGWYRLAVAAGVWFIVR